MKREREREKYGLGSRVDLFTLLLFRSTFETEVQMFNNNTMECKTLGFSVWCVKIITSIFILI